VCFRLVNHDPLAVSSFDAKFPPEIDRIVFRALAKDPNQRYQTGMEMATDIRQLRESCGPLQADGKATSFNDAIRPFLIGKAGTSAGLRSQPNYGSIAGLRDQQAEQSRRSWIRWNGLLPVALLASAIGFVTFSTKKSADPKPYQAAKTELAVEPTGNSGKGMAAPPATVPGTLQIEIHHQFASAQASVWLDNRLIYTHSLHGDKKTRALVFRKVEGHQF
jgi:hypothetical protein